MQVRLWQHGNAFIVYDGELIEAPTPDLFDPAWWKAQALSRGTFEGRGRVHIVHHGTSHWVLRSYRRGGLPAKVARSGYTWPGLQRTRPWREWHLLAEMRRRGLPVPRPVAAHVSRAGLTYRGHLLSELIPDAHPLGEALREGGRTRVDWRRLGATLCRFHDAGVHHPDLNVRNILVRGSGDFYLLDFDRGRLGAGIQQFRQNLKRLRRSIDKLATQDPQCRIDDADWGELLKGWGSPSPASTSGFGSYAAILASTLFL